MVTRLNQIAFAIGLIMILSSLSTLAQQRPGLGQAVSGAASNQGAGGQAAVPPDNVALAYTMLGNSIRELLAKYEAETTSLRSNLQQTSAGTAASEAWWHICIKEPACVSWVQAPTGQPDSSGNVPSREGAK